jgi:type I restriction enzyme S subunit
MKWEMVNLGDIITISKGKKHNPIENGKNRYINIENLHNASNSLFTNEAGVFVEERDLIIAWDGANAGKVGIGFIGVIGSTLARMKIIGKESNPRFLYWFLESKNELIKSQRTGATIPHVNGNSLKDLQIPLPPLATQARIVEVLDAADALRRKDQALLEKYDALAQAIFVDMFGDPVRNEKGWEVKKLGEMCEINSGSTPSRENIAYFKGHIPWVKTTEVKGEVISETEEKISIDALKNSSCKLNPKNSIVVAMYGQGKTRGNVGILSIEATTNQACGVLRPNENYNSIFVFFLLKSMYNELRQLSRGGNQENLNLDIIKKFPIYFPPKSLQDSFEKIILKFDLIKQIIIQKHSETLFQSLLQSAFSGELA